MARRRSRAAVILGFGAVVGLGIAGCASSSSPSQSGTGSQSEPTIALVNGDNADPFFLSIWAGAAAEAKKDKINLVEQAPTSYDYTQQLPLFSDEIARGVQGIILSPDSNTAFAAAYEQAHGANIPVVDVNTIQKLQNDNPNILAFAGSSPLLLGNLAAKDMAQFLGGAGKVLVINSVAGSLGDEQRGSGFTDLVHSSFPSMQLLKEQYDMDDRQTADSIATDAIRANPDLRGIYGVDSFTGQGVGTAIQALQDQGKVKLIAVDAEPQEVALMKSGVIQTLIAQQPYQMGVAAVHDIALDLQGKKSQVVRSLILPPVSVTPANLNSPDIQKVVYTATKP